MITLDPASPVPPYEQVRAQLADQINGRELVAGTRLPTVRRLASDLGLAINTVARAYRELETSGLVETRGRAGTFVSGSGVEQEARAAAHAYLERIRTLGLDAVDSVRLLQGLLDQKAPR
ncbi:MULTISPECIES: GntR family transcriptional regulator [Nocardioides]|uniref:GntR family transcriptional regulator n=1 Tax=Nocardioides vastitatis TaxID=2568655 RepID=A0ABW0ZQT8_9ACTN|nr:GntR family transcriptional regulator [Nocardioides sp.]THI96161.1 GntR family transcriptional regulator [Nocardioides sp.]